MEQPDPAGPRDHATPHGAPADAGAAAAASVPHAVSPIAPGASAPHAASPTAPGASVSAAASATVPPAATAVAPASTVAFVTLSELALLFGRIGITSFGGGLSAWLYREVVGKRHWLPDEDFLGALTMAQVLPGANILNLSVYVGHRLRGAVGATVALASLLLPPMVVVIGITELFERVGEMVWLHDFLEGVAASAIGLTAAMGLRTAQRAYKNGRWTVGIVIAVFACIGLLHWPLVPVVLVLAAVAMVLARGAAPASASAKADAAASPPPANSTTPAPPSAPRGEDK